MHNPGTDEKVTPRIAVVIVNYRTADLVIGAFKSLKQECAAFPGATVCIVDNASPDGDAAKLEALARREDSIRFIANPTNAGFGAGNNVALRRLLAGPAPPDYILLLNPDARLLPGALATLVRFLETHPDAGFAGPAIEGEDGGAQTSAFRFFSILGEVETAAKTGLVTALLKPWRTPIPPDGDTRRIDWLSGAAVLVRRAVFETAGLFDEGYFLYFEETDLMWAARKKGWSCWRVPAARAVHLEGASTGHTGGKTPDFALSDVWLQSRARYFRKNYGAARAFLADIAWMLGALFHLVRAAIFGGDPRAVARSIRRVAGAGLGARRPKSSACDSSAIETRRGGP